MRANFRNGLRLVGREIEGLFMRQAGAVGEQVDPAHHRLTRPTAPKPAPASGSRPKRGAFPVRTHGILIRMPLRVGR